MFEKAIRNEKIEVIFNPFKKVLIARKAKSFSSVYYLFCFFYSCQKILHI